MSCPWGVRSRSGHNLCKTASMSKLGFRLFTIIMTSNRCRLLMSNFRCNADTHCSFGGTFMLRSLFGLYDLGRSSVLPLLVSFPQPWVHTLLAASGRPRKVTERFIRLRSLRAQVSIDRWFENAQVRRGELFVRTEAQSSSTASSMEMHDREDSPMRNRYAGFARSTFICVTFTGLTSGSGCAGLIHVFGRSNASYECV